jgi:hypothetical protein
VTVPSSPSWQGSGLLIRHSLVRVQPREPCPQPPVGGSALITRVRIPPRVLVAVAQLGERRSETPGEAGSKPTSHPKPRVVDVGTSRGLYSPVALGHTWVVAGDAHHALVAHWSRAPGSEAGGGRFDSSRGYQAVAIVVGRRLACKASVRGSSPRFGSTSRHPLWPPGRAWAQLLLITADFAWFDAKARDKSGAMRSCTDGRHFGRGRR